MKNQMQVFENKDFGKIRVVEIDGQSWWALKDVCAALELKSPHKVAERLDEDERNLIPLTDNIGRSQKTTIINESGLYAVILRSDKIKAKAFRRWITQEVLPTIRKHGAYITEGKLDELLTNPASVMKLFNLLKAEREKKEALHDYIETIAPKARYYDVILKCDNSIPVSVIAKDYGMTAVSFNKLLNGSQTLKVFYRAFSRSSTLLILYPLLKYAKGGSKQGRNK